MWARGESSKNMESGYRMKESRGGGFPSRVLLTPTYSPEKCSSSGYAAISAAIHSKAKGKHCWASDPQARNCNSVKKGQQNGCYTYSLVLGHSLAYSRFGSCQRALLVRKQTTGMIVNHTRFDVGAVEYFRFFPQLSPRQ